LELDFKEFGDLSVDTELMHIMGTSSFLLIQIKRILYPYAWDQKCFRFYIFSDFETFAYS
jgi:hypothetical protein